MARGGANRKTDLVRGERVEGVGKLGGLWGHEKYSWGQ